MTYLLIDTKTSGAFDFSKPADAEGQPRLAQLSLMYLDAELQHVQTIVNAIRPDGWSLSDDPAFSGGLTNDALIERGVPVIEAIALYAQAIDNGATVVAYNAQYHTKVMRGEMRRAGVDDRFEKTPNICVMRGLVDVVQVPKKSGKGFKLPKLVEACAFFGIDHDPANAAAEDIVALEALFRRMDQLSIIPVAEVHFAKEQPARSEAL